MIIPIELIVEIVARLPTKYLLRCKAVCKDWHRLITHDSHLAHLHFRKAKIHKYVAVVQSCPFQKKMFALHRRTKTLSPLPLDFFLTPEGRAMTPFEGVAVRAASNGLFCCSTLSISSHDDFNYYVFNPITRNLRLLSPPASPGFIHSVGLTFDPSPLPSKFTVLLFGKHRERPFSLFCHMFDSSINEWQLAPFSPLLDHAQLYRDHKVVYSHGSAYLLIYYIRRPRCNRLALLALDMNSRSWRRIPLPKEAQQSYKSSDCSRIGLMELGSSVALFDVGTTTGPCVFVIWRLLPQIEKWMLVERLEYSSFEAEPVALNSRVYFFWDFGSNSLLAYYRRLRRWKKIQQAKSAFVDDLCYPELSHRFRSTLFSP